MSENVSADFLWRVYLYTYNRPDATSADIAATRAQWWAAVEREASAPLDTQEEE